MEALDTTALGSELEAVSASNEHLQRENELFEAYLTRMAPAASASQEDEPKRTAAGKGKVPPAVTPAKQRVLSTDEKYEIASGEIDVLQARIEKVKNDGELQLGALRAEFEEADLRLQETKKDTYEFKRDIVVGAENFRTGKTAAEKMLRYMETAAASKEAMIEKLRLKNATLKSQIQKLEQQLQQKEEMGEVLHVIDFDQLKIENQQYLEKIEERNNELLRLKLTTGKTVQVLNKLKKKLGELTAQSEWLEKEMAERRVQLDKFSDDIKRVSDEKSLAEKQCKLLHAEQDDSDLPRVMDYIKIKSAESALEKQVLELERKTKM